MFKQIPTKLSVSTVFKKTKIKPFFGNAVKLSFTFEVFKTLNVLCFFKHIYTICLFFDNV